MIRPLLFALAVLALVPLDAAAQYKGKGKIYKCKNEKGETYFTQSYDPKYCGGGASEMNEQGIAIKQIDRVKTAEELAAEKAQAERDAEAKRLVEAKQHEDQVLLQSYATEDELVRVHQDELKVIDTAIVTTRMSMKNQEKSLAELLASAAESERAGKPVPPNIATSIGTVRKQIETQNAFIARKEQEKADATAGFDARRERYRELKSAQQKHLSGGSP